MQDTALHLPQHEIPMEYYKMASNIANSFSKEYNAIGVLDLNDLTQEGYLALLISLVGRTILFTILCLLFTRQNFVSVLPMSPINII